LYDVLSRENMQLAMKRVRANKGSPGSDNLTIEETVNLLKSEWPSIKELLLQGKYQPSPVRTVYIPKPNGKGQRMLGIPSVLDRLIQQAIHQKLVLIFDPRFSDNSFGFRPGRNAQQAVRQAHQHLRDNYRFAVDIDLEKFFDKVNHDRLMAKIAVNITDKPLLKLIRRYLQNGMMTNGILVERRSGTPQGSPLSPLLSNIVLDELDKELEKRGHKYCRYADDVQVHVKSRQAGERVLNSLINFIEKRLKLVVNKEKSRVGDITRTNFLGYSFVGWQHPRIRCSNETIKRFKHRIRQLTRGHKREALEVKLKALDIYIRGWMSYFRLTQTRRKLQDLDSWIRSRLRMCQMKQWFLPRTRVRNMIKLGLPEEEAKGYGAHKRWWFYAQLHHSRFYLHNQYWYLRGYKGLVHYYDKFVNI
jgi:group II intron reverse transcriptase/maturase